MVGEGILYSSSPPPAEMKPLQLSALENQAAKQEATTAVTRKRRRVSFAPETQATHEDDDVMITKVVESNKDLDLQERDATRAGSPQSKEPRTLDTPHQHPGASSRRLESAVGVSETPKPPSETQVESSLENPGTLIPRCETKHSESPPDLPAKPSHRVLEVEGQSKDRLSDEDSIASSIASSISSVTSDVTTGKKKRGRPKGRPRVSAIKKTKMNLTAVKVQEQKEQEALKEGLDEPEGVTVKSRKRHRHRGRGGKRAAAVTTAMKEAEDEMGERESEVGEGGREGETKKRRLSQNDEPEAPETARGEAVFICTVDREIFAVKNFSPVA